MHTDSMILKAIREDHVERAIRLLEDNVREQYAKKKGARPKEITCVKKLAKSAKERDLVGYLPANYDGRDWFVFTDGYRFIMTGQSFGYEDANKDRDEAYRRDANGMVRPLLDAYFTHDFVPRSDTRICELDETKVNTVCAMHTILPYVISAHDPADPARSYAIGLNPNYLKEMIEFVGNTTMYIIPDKNAYCRPVVFMSEDKSRIGAICPVNIVKAGGNGGSFDESAVAYNECVTYR